MTPIVLPFGDHVPQIADDAYVAPTAVLIGDVTVEAGASIWFGAVLRGDFAPIIVGPGSNVQDNCVLHTAEDCPTVLGRDVTVGHAAVLEGCRIGDTALVGMGAVVLNRAHVGDGAMLAAGSVVTEDAVIPSGSLAAGVPAVVKRTLSGNAEGWVRMAAREYHRLRDAYATMTSAAPR